MGKQTESTLYILRDELLPSFWEKYEKSHDFDREAVAITKTHPLILHAEESGLKKIIRKREKDLLAKDSNYAESLRIRTVGDWIAEWKEMHNLLYSEVFPPGPNRGAIRDIDVRFGGPGEDELFCIPKKQAVNSEVNELAYKMKELLTRDRETIDDTCLILAEIHYQFVRIHPFRDGNGRLARVLTDQVCQYFNLPPAMGGYPRHNANQQKDYHKAIRNCAETHQYDLLASWIKKYVDASIHKTA